MLRCTSQIIHTEVEVVNGGRKFKCTFIYGYNEKRGREEMWRELRQMAINDDPWLILGNFNALLSIEDRLGQPVRAGKIEDMKDCMEDCKMMEVKVGSFLLGITSRKEVIECSVSWTRSWEMKDGLMHGNTQKLLFFLKENLTIALWW